MDPLEQFKTTFFEECSELLASAEIHLATLESGEADGETLHAVFRAIHSIKGGAGVFGFQRLVGFAHVFETALDALRAGRINATPEIVSIFIRANDALSDFVRAAQQDETLPDDFGAMLLHALEQAAGAGTAEHPPVLATAAATGVATEAAVAAGSPSTSAAACSSACISAAPKSSGSVLSCCAA